MRARWAARSSTADDGSSRLLGGYAFLAYVFLYAPILVVVVFAFNGGRDVLFWEGFSTKWFEVALQHAGDHGRAAPERPDRARKRGRRMRARDDARARVAAMRAWFRTPIDALAYMTLVTPEIVFAIAALVFFVQAGDGSDSRTRSGWQTILIAHVVFNASVVALVVRAGSCRWGRPRGGVVRPRRGAARDVPPGNAAAARAGDPRRRAARVHVLVRRLHHVVLRDGTDVGDAADLHLGPAPLRRHACDQRHRGDDARAHARRSSSSRTSSCDAPSRTGERRRVSRRAADPAARRP